MRERYFEEFSAGQIYRTKTITVDKAAMIEFATEYDPQSFHVNEEAARASFFGGLAASGWYTGALTAQLLVDSDIKPAGGLINAGFDEFRLPRPVRAGDQLYVEAEVLEVRPSKSRPEYGWVKLRMTTTNQNGEPVQVMVANFIVQRRPA
ncbi:MAG: MaoC family dehydratase [Burkholderiales bacterium]